MRKSFSKRWKQAWRAKEEALRARFIRTSEKLNAHCRQLPPLECGKRCFVQNQHGPLRNKWHNTGTVMEVLPFNQYVIKMDGSRKLTKRNRRFLRAYTPASVNTEPQPPPLDIVEPAQLIPPVHDNTVLQGEDGKEDAASVSPTDLEHIDDRIPSPNSERVTTSHESELIEDQPSVTRRQPRCLSQLRDYNAPGLKEGMRSSRRR